MSTQVLVFESDAAFANEVRTELSKLDCEVTVLDDGNAGIQQAQAHRPDLILLAIELPRMNGFSVCNKLKKDPGLKDVPLIILSSESSEETFDQHRKLRTRAEHYAQKPISFGELVQIIRRFVPLGESPTGEGEAVELSEDVLVVEDDLIIEDDSPDSGRSSRRPSQGPGARSQSARPAARASNPPPIPSQRPQGNPEPPATSLDAIDMSSFDDAFGKLTIGGLPSVAPRGDSIPAREPSVPPAPLVPDLSSMEAVSPASLGGIPSTVLSSVDSVPPLAPRVSSAPPPPPAPLEEISDLPALSNSVPAPRPSKPLSLLDPPAAPNASEKQLYEENKSLTSSLEEARAELERLRPLVEEKASMQSEIDDLRGKVGAAGKSAGVSSREFLELRENLNKKDKEILSLKEGLAKKDKEALDIQERMLGLERKSGDVEERSLALERAVNESRERNEVLEADKAQAKKASEDHRARFEKANTEAESRGKELAELRAKYTETVTSHERLVTDLRQDHETKLKTAVDEVRDEAERSREQATNAALERLRAELELRQENALQARHAELSERYAAELAGRMEEHKDELSRVTATHQRDFEAAKLAHANETREREQAAKEALDNVRREAEAAITRREAELIQAHAASRAAEEARVQEQITTLTNEWAERIDRAERDRDDKVAALTAEKEASENALRSEMAQRIRSVEGDRDSRLAETEARAQREASELRGSLGDARATLEARTAELNAEIASLRGELQNQQAQRENEANQARSTLANLGEQLRESTQQRETVAQELANARTTYEQEANGLRERIKGLESDVSRLSTELSNRSERLEAESARASRAHSKWESDRVSLERAKDALAVALQQIEETEGRT